MNGAELRQTPQQMGAEQSQTTPYPEPVWRTFESFAGTPMADVIQGEGDVLGANGPGPADDSGEPGLISNTSDVYFSTLPEVAS